LAPRELTPPLHSLPPILDSESQTSTSSCSKGSRGLSVQPRVLGIFTETTISPDPSKRQRPSRYAIRAGRNFALILRFRRRRLSHHLGKIAKGRRLITAMVFRGRRRDCDLIVLERTTQSLRGQTLASRLPTGLPSRCDDVLEASHTRRAFPLLAGFVIGIASKAGN
jgi:hypothetical protein